MIGPQQIRTIGRSAAAQCSFNDDDHMSGIHFEVENFGSYAEVRDRRSTNRTWHNNQPITTATLKHGDRLRAGKTILGIELEQADAHAVTSDSAYDVGGSLPACGAAALAAPAAASAIARAPVVPSISSPPSAPSRESVGAPAAIPAAELPPLTPLFYESPSGPRSPAAPLKPAAPLQPAVPLGQPAYRNSSPIETGSVQIAADALTPLPAMPQERFASQARDDSPVSDSGSWCYAPPDSRSSAPIDKRRFRQYERVGDFQSVHNLRTIINALRLKKTIRVIAHFAKIRMTPPEGLALSPVYPDYPGALTHLPTSMSWQDWESDAVQAVAMRLCNCDALIVLVSEFHTDLDREIQLVGSAGLPGFCEPGGFLGWSWPSAFLLMIHSHGSRKWSEVLGAVIEGAIMYQPTHPDTLMAFAAESLASELQPLGFTAEL